MTEVLRAYKFALDPTPAQEQALLRWAGNARLAFNYAIAAKKASHETWREQVDALTATGVPEEQARKQIKVPIPTFFDVRKAFTRERGDTRTGIEGVCPWFHEVNRHVFVSAFIDATGPDPEAATRVRPEDHRTAHVGPRPPDRGKAPELPCPPTGRRS